jgi:hypothetical protein
MLMEHKEDLVLQELPFLVETVVLVDTLQVR